MAPVAARVEAMPHPRPAPRAARPIRIGLAWHSLDSGNLGIGALTVANHALAREAALELGLAPRFVVYAPIGGDAQTLDLPDTEVFAINRRTLLARDGFLASVRALDCMLDIGAGDSFADIYGPRRFAFLWLTKMMTSWRDVPLVLSPQTIGPFEKPVYRALAASAMQRSAIVFARDRRSADVARAMTPRADVRLAVDVAFELPYEDHSVARGGRRVRVGVNASGLLFHEAEAGTNRFGLSYDYAAMTRALLGELCARPDVDVFLIAHAISARDPRDDDSRLADRLATEFPGAERVPDFAGPSQAKSFISGLDVLVAARMHACIGALSSGTPVVPVAYSRKFSGLFGLLGYDVRLPETGYDAPRAVQHVLDAIDRRDQLARDVEQARAKVRPLMDTYRAGLREVFARAVAAKA
ncbi:polysaccharide pyruvyl transferase family protein [Novosphingobium huizhouense]|uniref:polysaccharide pyruvyl transferase family protein n=1 Tax=Novosphingobium huizhouense TaxID=2866625 RepID=UPI001CD8236C|nr:polysaccharide pyruvyl transferase family protein [Novosphingobium huizhouense]